MLCAGNIGRSPLAEVMLRHRLAVGLDVSEADLGQHGVTVTSAGTNAPEGHPASQRGVAFASERGLDLGGHRATQLSAAAITAADLIYCMDTQQVAAVTAIDPSSLSKVKLLAGAGVEIPDPHHRSDAFFCDVAVRIERAILELVPALLDALGGSRGEASVEQ